MKEKLIELIEKFPQARLLCVGDVMIDRFVQGKIDRISPEAPVPVFQFIQEREMLGGAGNVVANLQALCCLTYFVGMVGRDKFGEDVCDLLSRIKADYYLLKSKTRPTVMKARFIAGNQHILRFDQERIIPLNELEEKELLTVVQKRLEKTDLLLLSDYAKGLLTPSFTQKVIALCTEKGVRVLVDPKGNDYSKYAGAFLIKPNRKELEGACGAVLEPSSPTFLGDLSNAAHQILDKYQIQNMIVTLSEKGMLFVSADRTEQEIYLSTYAQEVFDVSGAGDTSLATLGAALSVGANMRQAMELSNLSAGVVVSKIGTATLTADELKAQVNGREYQ